MRYDLAADFSDQGVPPFRSYPPSRLQRIAITLGHRLPQNYAGQRAAGWIRRIVQATANAPVDVEVLGIRMRLRLNDNSCERRLMVTPHFFEPASLHALGQQFRPGFRFVDVGANVGTYSLLAARAGGNNAKVLAIEPNPGLTKRLRENAALNGLDIIVEQVAASDRNGKVTLRRDSNNLGASTLVANVNVRSQAPPLEVIGAKILDVVGKHGFDRIDAMKLDIEGGEDKALMAFLKEAPKNLWPAFLLIEHNRDVWQWDLEAELVERGWRRLDNGENLMFERS
ncbi:MAG: FkbM family methyltransferase [Alphaproteobacteria bacterium]|nr:FkbM family methyltransferase [Alphaproteobacteria bacterium]